MREDIKSINPESEQQAQDFLKLLEDNESNIAELYRYIFFPENDSKDSEES